MSNEEIKVPRNKHENIVTMEDGREVNFGFRKLYTEFLNEAEVRFNLISGQFVEFIIPHLDGLTKFQKDAMVYGIVNRVKSAAQNEADQSKVLETIKKQIELFGNEVFMAAREYTSKLQISTWQLAFAKYRAETQPDEYASWANIPEDETATKALLDEWKNFSKDTLSAIRKNALIKIHYSILNQAKLAAEATKAAQNGGLELL